MKSIRDYIDLVEAIWWPKSGGAATPPNTATPGKTAPASEPLMVRAAPKPGASAPRKPATAPNLLSPQGSLAVNNLAKWAHGARNGQDNYDMIVMVAKTLRKLAAEDGMTQFDGLLSQILRDPDNCQQAAEDLHRQFTALMAASAKSQH